MTQDNIWLYHPGKGLYSLDKVLFEQSHTREDILTANPGFSGSFAEPDSQQVREFYGIDTASGHMVITDTRGYRYLLNEESLALTPFDGEYQPIMFGSVYSLAGSLDAEPRDLVMRGDLRKTVTVDKVPILDGESFIEGQFMLPGLADSFFIAHKETVAPDAELLVSHVSSDPEGKYRLDWTVNIPGIVYDINLADNFNPLTSTFSSGDPEYRFMHFETAGDRFCFVYVLHAGCIDIPTGKLLWLKSL